MVIEPPSLETQITQIRKRLQHCSVGIAGLGGLGSNAAVALARSHIGKLVLVDFDIVEPTNLNRQYYFLNQIGQPKTDALKDTIQNINPQVTIETHTLFLEQGAMDQPFHNVDLIIEALDNAETKTTFIEEIQQSLPTTPLIAASGVTGYGHSDRIHTQQIGTLYLVYDNKAKGIEEDILTAPRVSLIANWQANLALEILLGEQE